MVPLLTLAVTWAVPILPCPHCSLGESVQHCWALAQAQWLGLRWAEERCARASTLAEGTISADSAGPGWLCPRRSWAVHHGQAVALVAYCRTAAWVPSSGPRGWSSSLQQAAVAVACSSQTRTGSIPLLPLPVSPRDQGEQDRTQGTRAGYYGGRGHTSRVSRSRPLLSRG